MNLPKKSGAVTALVFGALFILGAVICVILWAVLEDADKGMLCIILGVIFLFTSILILFLGINQLNVVKK